MHKTHSLSKLFSELEVTDQAVLREYYNDYKATIGGRVGEFPYKSLDYFLCNLDGDKDAHGNHIGSFDWRYYLIEEKRSKEMPIVSLDYLYEIVYGCIKIAEHEINKNFEPTLETRSWRLRFQRMQKHEDWLNVRRNSDGWDELGDRLEILWGPDYLGRYDLCLVRGEGVQTDFSKLPDNFTLPVIDKREEIESFDVD